MSAVASSRRRSVFKAKSAGVLFVVLLSFVGPLTVVLDRWLKVDSLHGWLRATWCHSAFLCGSAWPSYFLLIFGCTLAVIASVAALGAAKIDQSIKPAPESQGASPRLVQRRAAVALIGLAAVGMILTILRLSLRSGPPTGYLAVCVLYFVGWILLTTPLTAMRRFWLAKWRLILAYVLGFAAVSRGLFDYYHSHGLGFLSLLIIAGAATALYLVRHRLALIYGVFLLAVVGFSLQLSASYFSFIGDEYSFYGAARYVADRSSIGTVDARLFNGTFVYNTHPYLSSALQALAMKFYDDLGFGWRFSSILASALAVVFFYLFFSVFLRRRTALAGAFFVASSHYLMSFSRIGYNSTQALLAMSMALAAAAWAIKSGRRLAWVATGASIAFCFYVFPAALYAIPVALLLIVLYRPPWRHDTARDWGILVFSALVVVLPLLFQPMYWSTKLGGTFLAPDAGTPGQMQLTTRLLSQFGYSFFSFLYLIQESHFVTVACEDAVTAALVLLGVGALLRRLRIDKFAFFVSSSLVLLVFLVGASHQYPLPPNTRLFLLVPWFSLVAAIGLGWVAERLNLGLGSRSRRLSVSAFGLFLSLVLGLNLYQAYVISVQRSQCCRNFTTSFVQLSQNVAAQPAVMPQAILLLYRPSQYDITMLKQILQADYVSTSIRDLTVSPNEISNLRPEISAADQVVVIDPSLPDPVRAAYGVALQATRRLGCQMATPGGRPNFEVWYASSLPSPCAQPQAAGINILRVWPAAFLGIFALFMYGARDTLSQLVPSTARTISRIGAYLRSQVSRPRKRTSRMAMKASGRLPTQSSRRPKKAVAAGRRSTSHVSRSAAGVKNPRVFVAPGDAKQSAISFALLLLALLVGALAEWQLRQPQAIHEWWPWVLLGAAMFMGAFVLLRSAKRLPGSPVLAAIEHMPATRRRLVGAACVGIACLASAAVAWRLWPDYHSRWHGTPTVWLIAVTVSLIGSWLIGAVGVGAARAASAIERWSLTSRKQALEIAAFVLILAVAVFLRIYRLPSLPPGIYGDETSGAIDGLYILQGRPTSPFATGWGWVPNGYFYYMALVFRIFGANWIGLKAVSLIPALLTIPAIYLLGRQLFGRMTGLIAMALLAVNRWHFSFSRWGWMETVPPLLEVMAFFFFIRGLRERRALDYALSGLIAGVALYTYFSARLLAPTLALYVLAWILANPSGIRRALAESWQGLVILGLAFAAVVAPLAVTFATDPPVFNQHVSSLSVLHRVDEEGSLTPLVQNILLDLRSFQQLGPGNARLNLPREPLLDPVTGLLFTMGAAMAIVAWRDHRSLLLLLWVVLGLSGSFLSVLSDGPNSFRSLNALPAIILLASHALTMVVLASYRALQDRLGPRSRLGIAGLAAGVVVVAFIVGAAIWESNVYFVHQASSMDAVRAFDPVETGVARDTRAAVQSGTTVYMSPNFYGHSIVRFMTYDALAITASASPLDNPPYKEIVPEVSLPLNSDGKDALLLLHRQYWPLMDFFTSLYPRAHAELVQLADNTPLYVRLAIPAAQVAALQGLTEHLAYRDGSQQQHLVSQVSLSDDAALTSAEWSGTIRLPRGGEYNLLGQGGLQVFLDGRAWTGARYQGRGLYGLRVVRSGGSVGDVRLDWQIPKGVQELVPATAMFSLPAYPHGLLATYWANMKWEGEPLYSQILPFVLLTWPSGSDVSPTQEFSARLTGTLSVPASGNYLLRVEADDGARLTIDGRVVSEGLVPGRENDFDGTAVLDEGDHPIQVDYFQTGGSMALRLYWRRATDAPWMPIPSSSLRPAQP